jgi:hypothetical protein
VAKAAVKTIAAGGVLLLALVTACSGNNAQTNSFNTLADAQQGGAIEQGLLPDRLPPGTRDIRIGHGSGQVRSWGLFNFPPDQADALKQILRPDELPLEGTTVDVPGRIEWWPRALRGTLNAEQLAITGLKAYSTADGARILAVNWSQGRAYYWGAD